MPALISQWVESGFFEVTLNPVTANPGKRRNRRSGGAMNFTGYPTSVDTNRAISHRPWAFIHPALRRSRSRSLAKLPSCLSNRLRVGSRQH